MNRALIRRRETLLTEMSKGRTIHDVAEEMAALAFPDKTEDRQKLFYAIEKDWTNRERWIPQIVRLQDPSLLSDIVAAVRAVKPEAWKIYADGESSASDKNAALRTVLKTEAVLADILIKVGVIQAAPQQIETTLTLAEMPFTVSPELRAVLDAEQKRQAEEKAKQPGPGPDNAG